MNAVTPSLPLYPSSPWHAGELEAQRLGNAPEAAARMGARAIRPAVGSGEAAFLSSAPLLAVAAVDGGGRPWASVMVGGPGFITSPDPKTVRVRAGAEASLLLPSIGDAVGMLVMEPLQRHRIRVNGTLTSREPGGFTIAVDQCYGNCPAHIAPRSVFPPEEAGRGGAESLAMLDEWAVELIQRADTAFVASISPDSGADLSHRGGPLGFVSVGEGGVLSVPDYAGNNYFNTLGNMVSNPRAGLTFVDFASGEALCLSGDVEIIWEGPEVAAYPKAKRLWRFHPTHIRRVTGVVAGKKDRS